MGLETPTVGLQVQPLAAPRSTFDSQSAVNDMIAAFRNGQVTTADLIERATKMPALRQQVADVTDPAQVAARKQILLENASQEALATEANKFALKQANDLAKIPASIRAKADDLAKHGALDPNFSAASYDENQKAIIEARWNSLQKWKRQAEMAATTLNTVKEAEVYDAAHNPLGKRPVVGQKRVNDAAHSSLQKYVAAYATPASFNDWLKDGAPEPNTDLINAPKGATVYLPAATPGAVPTLQKFPEGAPTREAAAKLAGDVLPGQSTLTVEANDPSAIGTPRIEAPKDPKLTEKQVTSLTFTARAKEANTVFDKLKSTSDFDPTSIWTWFQNTFFRGPLLHFKDQEVREFNSAKELWLQGLLRMESGAAISAKEQNWYESVFFPVLGDGDEVVKQKASMRNAVEQAARLAAQNADLGDSAMRKLEGAHEEFFKNYKSGNLAGTPAYNEKHGASTRPVTLGGKPTTYTQIGTKYFVPDPAQQKTNTPTKLKVDPKK